MASSPSSSLASTLSNSPFCPYPPSKFSSPLVSFSRPSGRSLPCSTPPAGTALERAAAAAAAVRAQTLDFSGTFFEGGLGSDDDPGSPPGSGATAVEDREEPQCPPGLRPYETMAVLRPDMSEDERLALTQKYEELLVAGGGMYVEVFNRGVIPLAYSIKKKNKAGESNTYLDGIYLLFTYFTKPESIETLEATLNTDDDVIRSSTFKIRKRKY
ncbi:LOW QUALITY PROTEIN: 30S ribosomal protein S6 alpha, chloroplastic-like [Eucalyptus grandis]|uniref:LOW QUALITY PROTEIN: 30S ribosomal protein S6 alpha, chloroplastic-like n=1 Tax=Eucalyptus grandis TaxID=71139 RepID=UPI00192EBF16|nr:LOW QUALITY PROTEIN: 30S ribosomal protein S6 alpha, chloroplastic-like [Eucalyptus grandis]